MSTGPSFAQIHAQSKERAIEHRTYRAVPGESRMGRSTIIVPCPFCKRPIVAYIWSIAGGGKRCDCGALFATGGDAYHWANVVSKEDEGDERKQIR